MPDLKDKELEKSGIDVVGEPSYSLSFDERVIKKIAGFSVGEIPGILAMSGNFITGLTDMLRSTDDPTKGISVEMGKKQVSVSMKIICEYGRNVPAIFQEIIDKIGNAVKEMTGLEVVEVKVHVSDVLTKEDFERQSKKKQDEKVEGDLVSPAERLDSDE